MRYLKYLLVIAFVFSFTGVTNAAGIPVTVDPQNAPEIWTQQVYNNDTVTLVSGTAVVWAMSADTADTSYAFRTMWVDQTTTANDINSAGIVVSENIAAGAMGTICIYGPVYARIADSTDGVTTDTCVGTSTVEGQIDDGLSADDTAVMGWSIEDSPVAETLGGYGGNDDEDGYMQPIFVNVSLMHEGS